MNSGVKRSGLVLSLVVAGASTACSPPPLVCNSDEVPTGGRCVSTASDAGPAGAVAMEAAVPEAGAPDAGMTDVVVERDVIVEACVPTEDLPDPDGLDTNCDGIDGDAANAVFVSSSAAAGGDGTRERPFRTLSDGLRVVTPSRRQVLIAGGDLMESIALPGNVIVAGGYEPMTWRVSEAQRTRLVAPCPVVTARRISNARLLRINVDGRDATEPGASCVAVLIEQADGLSWTDSRIRAGRGADGANGTPGAALTEAAPSGLAGQPADLSLAVQVRPNGGTGGATCAPGGAGGAAFYLGTAAERGANGAPSPAGGRGGESGVRGPFMGPTDPRVGGSPGADGLDGDSGASGVSSTSSFCTVDAMGYSNACASGANGNPGSAGAGGGGGGGGGLSDCGDGQSPKPGGAGGGGGGGGCGGGGGRGGAGGGASIAVLIVGGVAQLERVAIETAGGGRGGNGGAGASGGSGGAGGSGGGCRELMGLTVAACRCGSISSGTLTAARGGNGGRGGVGGRGGGGGGGAGGPSVGIVLVQDARVMGTTPFNVGRAGQGGVNGDGSGTRAANGLEQDTQSVARAL